MRKAFTLAEVLITLGIIGVVCAMAIPSLINNYQKKRTATKVKVFYSKISQALKHAESDYGEISYWIFDDEIFGSVQNNDVSMHKYENNKKFIEKYILPYLQVAESPVVNLSYNNDASVAEVRLLDGGIFLFSYQIRNNEKLGLIRYFIDGDSSNRSSRNMFVFMITERNGIKAFDSEWNNSVSKLINDSTWGCEKGVFEGRKNGLYCAKLLEINNWQFPDNYPW